MRIISVLLATVLGAGTLPTGASPGAGGVVVRTDAGPVRGTATRDLRIFRGIPYAAPPEGELRWRSPQPPRPWSDVRDATRPGPPCAQAPNELAGLPGSEAEDCLHVNVTTPRTRARPRPVIVYLHGGGFVSGAGDHYDAGLLALRGDVVVVTVNYRLGVLGFLGHPDLPGSGAFGLQDQQAALHWVRRNATAFGGDPARVTLAGESAGALSTCAHLTAPTSKGLFHRAIALSGSCGVRWLKNGLGRGSPEATTWAPPAEAHALARLYTAQLGCDTVDCLRRLPVSGLLANPLAPVLARPMYGSPVLPENPETALAAGRFHRVPVMNGHTRDEHRLLTAALYAPLIDEQQYAELVTDTFGADAPQVAGRYPLTRYTSPSEAWSAIMTDAGWACPTLADNRALAGRAPVYGFEFADRTAPWAGSTPPPFPLGAYHGSDLPYLFPDLALTPAQKRLSLTMVGYWARFARTGDPNGPGLPYWAPFEPGGDTVQSLAPAPDGTKPVDVAAGHQCAAWLTR
ncbi:carboxylesterase/lipase family protein [Nonomuraea typhae]|uniref:Carboxylic ester hydrolase n=1 Tax=Nonomuraea typhae TaxID=2603600 RepID=A0ABW7ZAM8_9ACTN